MACFTIKMVLFMMESGMKIRNQVGVKCSIQMVHFMMVNGMVIKCMVKGFIYQSIEINMKAISLMD